MERRLKVELMRSGIDGEEQLNSRARAAAMHVDLDPRIETLQLDFSVPEFAGVGFWQLENLGPNRLVATLYGGPSDILERPPLLSQSTGLEGSLAVKSRFDMLMADRWLHRNLLQLDDVLRGRVQPGALSREQIPALQACWDVWTDGRLRLWQHPGLSQAERRRAFFRIFAPSGLLLPRHWKVFHGLWEGKLEGQAGLEIAISQLPPA